jgi:hypothetical protein
MHLIMFSDFMQVLHSIRNQTTKNENFRHIIFTIIYLLQEQKLNPRNYSNQELNMGNFIQPIEYDVHIYAKFGGFMFCGVLKLNTPRFEFL